MQRQGVVVFDIRYVGVVQSQVGVRADESVIHLSQEKLSGLVVEETGRRILTHPEVDAGDIVLPDVGVCLSQVGRGEKL